MRDRIGNRDFNTVEGHLVKYTAYGQANRAHKKTPLWKRRLETIATKKTRARHGIRICSILAHRIYDRSGDLLFPWSSRFGYAVTNYSRPIPSIATLLVRFWYASAALLVRFSYASAALPLRFLCAPAALPLRLGYIATSRSIPSEATIPLRFDNASASPRPCRLRRRCSQRSRPLHAAFGAATRLNPQALPHACHAAIVRAAIRIKTHRTGFF